MATSTEKVMTRATEIVSSSPEGVRYSELHRRISSEFPDIPSNTVHGVLHKFRNELPDGVYLPVRGLYKHSKFDTDDERRTAGSATKAKRGRCPVLC